MQKYEYDAQISLLKTMEEKEYDDCTGHGLIEEMKKKLVEEIHNHSINQLPNGYWTTRVNTCMGLKLIKKKRREDLMDTLKQHYLEKDLAALTLLSIFEPWFRYKQKESSSANCKKLLWTWEKYYLPDKKFIGRELKNLKVISIQEWLLDQIHSHHLTRRQYREMKSVLNQMLDYAVLKEYIPNNPARMIHNIADRHFEIEAEKSLSEEVYTKDELQKLFAYLLTQYPVRRHIAYLAIALNLHLGLRVGELVGLKITDFNLRDHVVHIRRRETSFFTGDSQTMTKHGYMIDSHLKTVSSRRNLPLTESAEQLFCIICEERKKIAPEKWKCTEWLFLNEDGEAINSDSIHKALRRANRAIGTIQKSNHHIRKTVATQLVEAGTLSNEEIRRFMGHKSFVTTMHSYVRSTVPLQEKIDSISNALDVRCNIV